MTTATHLAQRLMQLSRRLERHANNIGNAFHHVDTELAHHDSMPTQTVGAAPATVTPSTRQPCTHCGGRGCDNCGPVELTRTERAALARAALTSDRATVIVDVDIIDNVITSAEYVVNRLLRHRIPTDKPSQALCSPVGHEGSLISIADGGWSDPLCHEIATRTGLCDRHYLAKRRWRIRQGLPTKDVA